MNTRNHKHFMALTVVGALVLLLCLMLFNCDKKKPTENEETETVTDIDGNVYRIVQIGEQTWMAENLRVTHYSNGEVIQNVTDNIAWTTLATGAYCNYANDESHVATYGRLYNWHAVNDNRKIAPSGWHVPSDAEWQTLVDYLGGSSVAGGKMKATDTTHWVAPNTGATNESKFTALPGGVRYNFSGSFGSMGYNTGFWSATEYNSELAWYWFLGCNSSNAFRAPNNKRDGFSLRLVKD